MNRATMAARSARAGQVNTVICITRPGPWLGFVTSAGKLSERSLAATLIIVEFITETATCTRLDFVQISLQGTLPLYSLRLLSYC